MPTVTLAEAERRLGVTFPTHLRAAYQESDGRFRADGTWWVMWPLKRLVAENEAAWLDNRLPRSFLAFGDDGTGNPFCVELNGAHDEVLHWSWIDADVNSVVGSMSDFERTWVNPPKFPCPCAVT